MTILWLRWKWSLLFECLLADLEVRSLTFYFFLKRAYSWNDAEYKACLVTCSVSPIIALKHKASTVFRLLNPVEKTEQLWKNSS